MSRLTAAAAFAEFKERLALLGAELVADEWLGGGSPHPAKCRNGHACSPRPNNVKKPGRGICLTCIGQDPAITEAAMLGRLAELGATPMWDAWRGSRYKHHVLCAGRHDCYPTWTNVQQGAGICLSCAGTDPVLAERAFRETVARLGGIVIGRYAGRAAPVHVRCAAGHDTYPMPTNLQRGQGICAACRGLAWDVFYVLEHESMPVVKFGISSNDGRARLAGHRRHGYTRVHRTATGLPEARARQIENAVRRALRDGGDRPVRGREYFDVSCLALILDVADSWLAEIPAA